MSLFGDNDNKRFKMVYSEGGDLTMNTIILVDMVTGVHYLFIKSGYGAGLTPLLNSDGTLFKQIDKIPEN